MKYREMLLKFVVDEDVSNSWLDNLERAGYVEPKSLDECGVAGYLFGLPRPQRFYKITEKGLNKLNPSDKKDK